MVATLSHSNNVIILNMRATLRAATQLRIRNVYFQKNKIICPILFYSILTYKSPYEVLYTKNTHTLIK